MEHENKNIQASTYGFDFNEHGVCVNPETILEVSDSKNFYYKLSIAQNYKGWVYGYRIIWNSRVMASGISIEDPGYKTKNEAILSGVQFILETIRKRIEDDPETNEHGGCLDRLINLEAAMCLHDEHNNNDSTDFFNRLFPLLDGIDVTMKLKRKNDKITLSFLPETTSELTPVIITGTADELDEGFFQAIKKPIEEAKGLKVFLDSYKDSVKKAGVKKDDKKSESKKPVSKTAEKKKEAKTEKKVEQKTEAPDMFADVK